MGKMEQLYQPQIMQKYPRLRSKDAVVSPSRLLQYRPNARLDVPTPTPTPTPPTPTPRSLTLVTPLIGPLVAAKSFGEDPLLLSARAMLAKPNAAAASLFSWVSCFGLVTSVPACTFPPVAPTWPADVFRDAVLGEKSVCRK